jgi:predicted DNA-binding antitoxin AbrB/MazE fold protein
MKVQLLKVRTYLVAVEGLNKVKSNNQTMSEVIECVYEGGVLKPFEKINLKENTRVQVTIKPKLNLGDFVMAKLPEEKIRELEERFESEDIY